MFFTGTKFGAMLDQLTDRCGTMGLLVTLSYFYPRYMFWFQISMVIDVACHWIYLQASVFKFTHEIDMNLSIISSQLNRNLSFDSGRPCKEKHRTNFSTRTRISSCVFTTKKMCSHLCASATRCSTVDCTYFTSPPVPHVSPFWAHSCSNLVIIAAANLYHSFYSVWHFNFQSAHSDCIPSRRCQKWHLLVARLCCGSKYFNHRSGRARGGSQT